MDLILLASEARQLASEAAVLEAGRYYFKAEKTLTLARASYISLAEADAAIYGSELARTWISSSRVYRKQRKFKQANAALTEVSSTVTSRFVDNAAMRAEHAYLYSMKGMVSAAAEEWDRISRSPDIEPAARAEAFSNLAEIFGRNNEAARSAEYYERAIQCYSNDFGFSLGRVLVAYGRMLADFTDWIGAKKALARATEALAFADEKESYESQEATLDLFDALVKVHRGMDDPVSAEASESDLKAMTADFGDRSRSAFDPFLGEIYSRSLHMTAAIYIFHADEEASKRAYLQEIELYKQLEKINPGTYLDLLATASHDLGTLSRNNDEFREAENRYNDAIVIRRRLAADYPDIYDPSLCKTLMSLSRMYLKQQDGWQAGTTMRGAVAIYERLANADPDTYAAELAASYKTLGQILYDHQDRTGAREVWAKWLILQEELTEANPEAEEANLIVALRKLVRFYIHYKQYDKADEYLDRLSAVKERYRHINPADYHTDMALVDSIKAQSAQRRGDYTLVEDFYHSAIRHHESQSAAFPERYKTDDHIQELIDLAKFYSDTAGEDPSIESLRKQLTVYEALDMLAPGSYRPFIADVLADLGSAYADGEDYVSAIEVRKRASEILEDLTRSDETNYGRQYADNLFWSAILYERTNETSAADEVYRRCLDVYERSTRDDNADLHLKYANASRYYGQFLHEQGEEERAKVYLEKAEAPANKKRVF